MTETATPRTIDLGPVAELPLGLSQVRVGARDLVVLRCEDGRVLAMAGRCPHRGAPLACGTAGTTFAPSAPGELALDDERLVVRCPWHGWEFDAATGEAIHGVSSRRLRTFETTVDAGRALVLIP